MLEMNVREDHIHMILSPNFQDVLHKYHVRQSMNHKGNCYDNAWMESFFSTLKKILSMVKNLKHGKNLSWLLLNILKLSIIAVGFTPHLETCHQWNMNVNIVTRKK